MPAEEVKRDGCKGSLPPAAGPYSHLVKAGELAFVSGQIPVDPATGELIGNDVAAATQQVIANLAAVLESAGLGLTDVVKTTIYLRDMADFAAVNEIYAASFSEPWPARSTVEVAALPRDAVVEIEAVARVAKQ